MATNNSLNTYIVPTATYEVTQPSQPAFLVYLATDDDDKVGAGSYTYGDTDVNTTLTEIYDQNADFTVGASGGAVFTAPVDGRYLLTLKASANDLTTAQQYSSQIITSNRTYEMIEAMGFTGGQLTGNIEIIADMDATDTAKFWLAIPDSTGLFGDVVGNANMESCMSGCLLV